MSLLKVSPFLLAIAFLSACGGSSSLNTIVEGDQDSAEPVVEDNGPVIKNSRITQSVIESALGNMIAQNIYTYNDDGYLISEKDELGSDITTHTYDQYNRLTKSVSVLDNEMYKEDFTYATTDNRQIQTHISTHSFEGESYEESITTFIYTPTGKLTGASVDVINYIENDEIVPDDGTRDYQITVDYNDDDLISQVTVSTLVKRFEYDFFNRLTKESLVTGTNEDGSEATLDNIYIYDSTGKLAEIQSYAPSSIIVR